MSHQKQFFKLSFRSIKIPPPFKKFDVFRRCNFNNFPSFPCHLPDMTKLPFARAEQAANVNKNRKKLHVQGILSPKMAIKQNGDKTVKLCESIISGLIELVSRECITYERVLCSPSSSVYVFLGRKMPFSLVLRARTKGHNRIPERMGKKNTTAWR